MLVENVGAGVCVGSIVECDYIVETLEGGALSFVSSGEDDRLKKS